MNGLTTSSLDMERVWLDALKLLGEIGLKVANPKIIRAVTGKLPIKGDRILFPKDVAEHYADEIRRSFGPVRPVASVQRVTIANSLLNTYWLDPEDGQLKPHDVASVTRLSRRVFQLAEKGLVAGGRPVGVPQNVPAGQQFLLAHYINCVNSRQPQAWAIMLSERLMRTFFQIADVMGLQKIIATELISPMKLMGQSVDLAIEFCKTDVAVGIDPLPVLGITAPADWHMAWAQTVAENLGCYVAFRECGIQQVKAPSFRLFLPNPVACTTYFSAPQHIMALLARRKVREFFGMSTQRGEFMLVTSKAPDQQAAMEKMAGCLLAKLYGIPQIVGAGGLWMDEIFSFSQLLIDIEIKSFVESIGTDFSGPASDIVAIVNEGMQSGSFLDANLTLERFKEFTWKSEFFDLGTRASWRGNHQSFLKKADQAALDMDDTYDYELTGNRREALEAVMDRAKKEFGWP